MKKLISLISILIAGFSFAQSYQGKINKVPENGLHQILLTPEVRSASQNNIDFLRIFDAKNNEVPYLFYEGKSSNSSFKNFTILSKTAVPNVATSVIISNENALNIDHLTLKIANTDVDKKYNISGSNDQKEWFGLVGNQKVIGLNDAGENFVERDFAFPLNNYKFLRFDFIDKNSLPINILGASLKESHSVNQSKTELQNFTQKIETDKKLKQTKITITFPNPQMVDGICFDISAPSYFLRDARILINKSRVYKKSNENYIENISAFQLNSKSKNRFDVQSFFAKEFIIEIDNQDNPALEIKKINLFQSPISILTDLKSNEIYTLKIDSTWSAPQYDLANSGIDFNQNYPVATISNLEKIEQSKSKEAEKTFWQTPLFMWICIVLAVAIIGYFAVGLIKDMNKEN
ncbi:hypothetical protein [Epilithonimonas hungarica]|uniref:DUF3999 domain-containing protein n=1 Tax=Epilithonimonas hungarica TaxID=454006 RepID=A0A1G7HL25_9FLAO|nr:hypothetical protein [Epilithonimonas hungarica]SDF01073.1 hypothetical protein SAMN05421825_0833 [Epilithonimonas hungarica]